MAGHVLSVLQSEEKNLTPPCYLEGTLHGRVVLEKDDMIISIMESKLGITCSITLHYTVQLEFIEEYRSTNPNQQSHEPGLKSSKPDTLPRATTSHASQVCTQ